MLVLLNDDIILGGLGFLSLSPAKLKSIDRLWELLRYRKIYGVLLESSLDNIRSCLRDGQVCEQVIENIAKKIQDVVEIKKVDLNDKSVIEKEARLLNLRNDDTALKLACTSLMNLDAVVALNVQDFSQGAFICVYSIETLLQVIQMNKLFFLTCPDKSTKNYLNKLDNLRSSVEKLPVNLGEWLHNFFNEDWKSIDDILSSQYQGYEFSFRGSLTGVTECLSEKLVRGKIFQLGQEGPRIVALIRLEAINTSGMNIWLEIYPVEGQECLPSGLKIMILDEKGIKVMQAEPREDPSVKLSFIGDYGECFSIELALSDVSVTENFVI